MEDLKKYNPEGSDLRRMQLRMLEMLKYIDSICTKHNIKYWLAFGTLLGAVRHSGFIPWDDDLDIQILEKDYSRLLKILEQELPPRYVIQTNKTDKNFCQYWAKIRDTHSVLEEHGNENYKYRGIFVDIFPVESVPSKWIKKKIDSFLFQAIKPKLEKTYYDRIVFYLFQLTLPLVMILVRILRWYYRNSSTNFTCCYGKEINDYHHINTLFPIQLIEFENHFFNAPNNSKQYLTDIFGDNYLEIPPVEKRMIHATKIVIYEEY